MKVSVRSLLLGSSLTLLFLLGVVFAATAAAAGRPDIKTVTVSRSLEGIVGFEIMFGAPVEFTSDTKVQVMIDTDRDPTTGTQGSEYALDYSAPWEGADPGAALLTARDGGADSSTPESLEVSVDAESIAFKISASAIGFQSVFDFWVFVEEKGKLVDTAPTHVLVSSASAPWTYPKGDIPTLGTPYPVETYSDTTDMSLIGGSFPWLPIVLGVVGLGALVGLGGYTYDRIRKRTPPAKPLTPSSA